MTKLLSLLLAGFFATSVFAQAVTTKPGDAMGPTGSTAASTSSGASASKGTPIKGKGDKMSDSAVTTKAGDAMGPTGDTTGRSHQSGASHSKSKKSYQNTDRDAAVTVAPGGAMGPTGATTSGPKK